MRFLLLFLCLAAAAAAEPLRHVANFNRDWKFQVGDVPAARDVAFDDAAWQRVGLPHTFSLPYFAAGDSFYVGYGWYRKEFTVPAEWQGRRLFLEFEAAFQEAEVFVNGKPVGSHRGGYTGFQLEITDAAVTGSNLVAVRLNNQWNPRIAPRAGEHAFSGGLYRNVWLVAQAPLHVTWYGTAVTTPSVSADAASVDVKTEIINQHAVAKECELLTEILDPSGTLVTSVRSSRRVSPGETVVLDQTLENIRKPLLWSPEHPALYTVRSIVHDAGTPVDELTSPLGFRWFEFTADRGFFLNGAHHYFKGANVHQDHAGWGDAVTNAGMTRDVQMMKDAGFDFIRGSHYPHAPAFSAACDRLGMLFLSENCFWGTAGFKSPWGASAYPTDAADEAEFEASVKASLRDMIRIHRNHPSIIGWSMGNEVFFSAPAVMPKVREFLKRLVAYSHELDPTRPAVMGGVQRGEIDRLGDVAAYNGDGARLFANPGVPNFVSEYGSMMTDRPGEYEPGWGDLPATPGADASQPGSWRLPWRSGEAIWCGFDHGSVAGRRFGAMGMIDYFRLPKRQWYWYRNAYRGVPPPTWPVQGHPARLSLTASGNEIRSADGTEDVHVAVTVLDGNGIPLSNCPPVTLTIVEGPGEFPTGTSITFESDSDIPIRDGQAAIEFRSYHAGTTKIQASSPGLEPAMVTIVSHGAPNYVAGVTPPVQPRPYRREERSPLQERVETFGRETPTRASSEAAQHGARFANDGDGRSFWQALPADEAPWVQVDLERIVHVQQVKLVFPTLDDWRYRVDVSENGIGNWQPFTDQTQTAGPKLEQVDRVGGTPVTGRFLRVFINRTPGGAGLAEVEIKGVLKAE